MKNIPLDLTHPLDKTPTIAKVGLLALASDFCLEDDLRLMLPEGFQVYTNRVTNKMPITQETLRDMQADISRAASALLPGSPPDCFIYGCTSGTAAIGYQQIYQDIKNATRRDVPLITPLSASIDALKYLNLRKISLLTPYVFDVSQLLVEQFQQAGIRITHHGYFGEDDDYRVHCISPKELYHAARQVFDPKADALFISCTSFRASHILESLENALNTTVICSNQALAFGTLRAMKQPLNIRQYGRLLRHEV